MLPFSWTEFLNVEEIRSSLIFWGRHSLYFLASWTRRSIPPLYSRSYPGIVLRVMSAAGLKAGSKALSRDNKLYTPPTKRSLQEPVCSQDIVPLITP